MKERDIVIVYGGHSKAGMAKLIAEKGFKDALIVTPEEAKQLPFPKSEPYVIQKVPEIKDLYGGKEFVCKGRHEYRQENDGWICQCGRKL